jgi:hypothetical protein
VHEKGPPTPKINSAAVKNLDQKELHFNAATEELKYQKSNMEALLESVDTTAALNNHICPTSIAHIQACN